MAWRRETEAVTRSLNQARDRVGAGDLTLKGTRDVVTTPQLAQARMTPSGHVPVRTRT